MTTIEDLPYTDIDDVYANNTKYSTLEYISDEYIQDLDNSSTPKYNPNKKYIIDKGTYLYAKNCGITTPNELTDLFKKIKNPRKIVNIDISDNHIDDHIDIPKIIEQLFTIKFPNLENISLSGNKLGHEFIMGLINISLKKYNKEIFFDISNNNFTPYDEKRILKAWPNGCIVLKSI